ncbi:MAG: ABC transporter ATP-binding protein [Kiritimatiellaeota bacterium]|nr:ABC transporter ATP-binding protein [Kiritimatiellota bacterium]
MKRSRFTQLVRFLRPYRGRMLWLVAFTVFLSLLAMLPPLIRAIIDRVITGGQRALLLPLAFFMLGLPILNAFCGYLQTLGIAYVGQRFVFDIRSALYDHLLHMSQRFFGSRSVGMLVNRLMGDTAMVQSMVTAQSIRVISDLVVSAFAITATLFLNWRLAMLLYLTIVVFVINYRMNIVRIRRATRSYRGAIDRLSGGVENRLTTSLAVKTFGTEYREQTSFRAESEASVNLIQEALYATNTFSMNTMLIQSLGRAVIYFLGCALVLRGDLSYGDVVAFTAYAMQLLWPAVRFSQLARQIQDVGVSVDRLFEIFDEEPEVSNRPGAVRIARLRGKVDFEHVFFHYEETNPVLTDFDLRVQAGETVALIGPTGCGKTTILSLILRFFDVCDGAVKLDDMDVRDIDLHCLRRNFGIVLQEPLLFTVSIAENIRYGKPGASAEEIERAARIAEIHDFIVSLPDGYDTVIGTEGLEFSVGQKQRLTIARAVAADPAILIMDEATSALDTESERAIQKAMDRVLKNRTSFIVAHRLSTIRNADRIVLLDKGCIVEMGNHEELMQLPDGRYRHLYNTHMGKGIIEE